jgi:hypothetical protein
MYCFYSHVITIKNSGSKAETYTLFHESAGTIISLPDKINYKTWPVTLDPKGVTVRLSQNRVTLQPGASTRVSVTITAPNGLDPKKLPIVSGWIHVNARSSAGDRLRVSYMGIAGSLKAAQTISTGNNYRVQPEDGGLPAIVYRRDSDGDWTSARELMDWAYLGTPVPIFAIAYVSRAEDPL